MDFLIELLVNAGVLFMLASILPGITVKSYGTAIVVCLVIGFLNATLGMFIRFPLNVITLFLITFFVRLLVSAIIIKLSAKLFTSFVVKSWSAAFILAIAMSVAAAVIDKIL